MRTAGGLTERDLPLAAGAQPAPVVRRAGELGLGIRNLAQTVAFAEAASRASDPKAYARYLRDKRRTGRKLGIDVDRDLIGQLTGDASLSIGVGGAFAMRSGLRDPAAAEATLRRAVPRLKRVAKGRSIGISAPKNGKGLYAVAQANGRSLVLGVVGRAFVVATDAARAAQFAAQRPSIVSGTNGSLVLAADARALVNAIAARRGQGTAAQLLTAALGDLTGAVESEPDGLSAALKLEIR